MLDIVNIAITCDIHPTSPPPPRPCGVNSTVLLAIQPRQNLLWCYQAVGGPRLSLLDVSHHLRGPCEVDPFIYPEPSLKEIDLLVSHIHHMSCGISESFPYPSYGQGWKVRPDAHCDPGDPKRLNFLKSSVSASWPQGESGRYLEMVLGLVPSLYPYIAISGWKKRQSTKIHIFIYPYFHISIYIYILYMYIHISTEHQVPNDGPAGAFLIPRCGLRLSSL